MEILLQVHLDKSAFQFLSEGVFSEIYGRVFEDSARAKILASEYGAFGLPPDILDPVYGLLRNDEVRSEEHTSELQSP